MSLIQELLSLPKTSDAGYMYIFAKNLGFVMNLEEAGHVKFTMDIAKAHKFGSAMKAEHIIKQNFLHAEDCTLLKIASQ